MARNRLHKILSRVIEIKPGEVRISLLLFSYYFLIMAPYYIIKPVRDAKYLIVEGSLNLPVAYLATAIFMGFFVALYSRLRVRIPRRVLIVSSLIFFVVTCFFSGLLFIQDVSWMPLAFWIWANVLVIVLTTQFWILVNVVFNPREAKRMIGFFASGGILGGVFGGLLTGYLGGKFPDYLLFIATGLLFFSIFVVNSIFIWQRKKTTIQHGSAYEEKAEKEELSRVGFKDCFDTVRKNHYLLIIAAIVTLTFTVPTFIDWQSKTIIENYYQPDEYTTFFGYFHAGLLVVPFFISILMTSNIIKRFGIRLTLLLYPMMLLLCSLGIAALPGIFFAIFIKGSDKSLSFSLNQSVRELLYIPISPEQKYRAKIFIDMFINRFAKGIGALILFIFILFPLNWQLRVRIVSGIAVLFILAWILLNLKASREYTNAVKSKLKLRWDRADQVVAETVDIDYTKLVFDLIESKDRSSVLYSLHLFDLIKQDKLTPELRKLVSYKSDEIKASSLGVLFAADETTMLPETEEYIDDEVLLKEIKEIMALDVYQDVMKDYADKLMVDESDESEVGKMELAKAIGLMDLQSPLIQKLEELLQEESPEISKYAVESAAKIGRRDYVPFIVQKLAHPLTRQDSSTALEKYGQRIMGTLSDYVGDSDEDIEVRRELTYVIARIGSQEAIDFLTMELEEDNEELDHDIIDSMDRIHSEHPELFFQKKIIRTKIAKEIKKYYKSLIHYFESTSEVSAEDHQVILPKNLSDSMSSIFKLLGLIYSHEDIFKAYQNLKAGTADSMAYAVELLDNTLEKEVRDVILPIVEDLPLGQRVRRCKNLLKVSPLFKKDHGKQNNI